MMRQRLGREIGAVIAAKLVLLCALYFLFFAPDHRTPSDAPAVGAHILGSGAG
ncbi:MAG TPA: hypothetical protein VNU97_11330 [Rhizomicrobium sp.]|jgi:hypothetical protein|nr:hypothetical protein [Rhizomicrobium sp.]